MHITWKKTDWIFATDFEWSVQQPQLHRCQHNAEVQYIPRAIHNIYLVARYVLSYSITKWSEEDDMICLVVENLFTPTYININIYQPIHGLSQKNTCIRHLIRGGVIITMAVFLHIQDEELKKNRRQIGEKMDGRQVQYKVYASSDKINPQPHARAISDQPKRVRWKLYRGGCRCPRYNAIYWCVWSTTKAKSSRSLLLADD